MKHYDTHLCSLIQLNCLQIIHVCNYCSQWRRNAIYLELVFKYFFQLFVTLVYNTENRIMLHIKIGINLAQISSEFTAIIIYTFVGSVNLTAVKISNQKWIKQRNILVWQNIIFLIIRLRSIEISNIFHHYIQRSYNYTNKSFANKTLLYANCMPLLE